MIIELPNHTLLKGAIYKCNFTDRGFMCLLWENSKGVKFIEHGHAFLHGSTDIVKIIRSNSTLVTGDLETLRRFIQVRTSSGTRLIWEKK